MRRVLLIAQIFAICLFSAVTASAEDQKLLDYLSDEEQRLHEITQEQIENNNVTLNTFFCQQAPFCEAILTGQNVGYEQAQRERLERARELAAQDPNYQPAN